MLGTIWGAQAAANAQSLGVNASALAATCVVESGCGVNIGNGSSAQGVFQMFSAAYTDGLKTALAANPSLASQIVPGLAGMNDPRTEAVAASGYLMQATQALQAGGIANPTAWMPVLTISLARPADCSSLKRAEIKVLPRPCQTSLRQRSKRMA